MVVPVYISTGSVECSHCSTSLPKLYFTNFLYLFFWVFRDIIVLIYNFLLNNEIEYFFSFVYWPMSSFVKCLFKSLAHFSIEFLNFFLLIYRNYSEHEPFNSYIWHTCLCPLYSLPFIFLMVIFWWTDILIFKVVNISIFSSIVIFLYHD